MERRCPRSTARPPTIRDSPDTNLGPREDTNPMSTATLGLAAGRASDQSMFPVLTPGQLERIARAGRQRSVSAGEVILEAGGPTARGFVIPEGEIELRPPAI